jgi:copper(I)-binding protein
MKSLLVILAALLGFASANAQTMAMGDIHIVDAKARPTAAGAATAAVYLTIMNHGPADDTLTAIATPVADKAEAHRTTNTNGIMTMEPAPNLTIKAGGGVTFAPGGLHIMLTGLKQPLVLGQTFPLTLTFAKAGAVETTVAVAPVGPAKHDMQGMPGMKM